MDPFITAIVTSLALGAAAGAKETATQAVKDAYSALKALLRRKYPSVRVDELEKHPESASERASVGTTLQREGAATDADVIQRAREILHLVREQEADLPETIGLALSDIEDSELTIDEISADSGGIGARIDKAKRIKLNVKRVSAGGDSPKKE